MQNTDRRKDNASETPGVKMTTALITSASASGTFLYVEGGYCLGFITVCSNDFRERCRDVKAKARKAPRFTLSANKIQKSRKECSQTPPKTLQKKVDVADNCAAIKRR